MVADTVLGLIEAQDPDAPAIGDTAGRGLSYGDLAALAHGTGAALAAAGIGRGDRVAIVLPNGPAMAACFPAIAAFATTAPLNPAYKRDEFAFYLGDLDARALIVAAGSDSPAVAEAEDRGIPILELTEDPGMPGDFSLAARAGSAATAARPVAPAPAGPEDVALILHTSGTTSRPKMVPLTHANVTASARHIAAALALTPADRCLNVMPLFHIHGLIGAVLSSLAAGASIACTPGFNALKFFTWLGEAKPSWYTAVPTMHQALLGRAARNADAVAAAKLRLIRSSSASLPRPVLEELEATFGCPVIESYGMTEASHQMASNPLPPRARKPGSVGIAAGPEVAVMDEAGRILPSGETGEIVIRGPNVTAGYVANPDANAKAFTAGWFRTGDEGVIDGEGYLTLTGRLKEIINRGGEKIAPKEVDDVLMDHPAVAQAVTFAVTHAALGEDVAAAVVAAEGAEPDPAELRRFCGERLAAFKVPREILVLPEIPKGATGKLQRIGLAKVLGLE